jgi:hypothetical protein
MFRVLQDEVTMYPILFVSGDQTYAFQVFEDHTGRFAFERFVRTEAIELVSPGVQKHGRPDPEGSPPSWNGNCQEALVMQ